MCCNLYFAESAVPAGGNSYNSTRKVRKYLLHPFSPYNGVIYNLHLHLLIHSSRCDHTPIACTLVL